MNTLTTNPPAANPAQSQRDESGRFCKGNRGGPGNPFTRQSAKLRQAAVDAVSSDDDVRSIIAALKEKALQGDVPASKLLLSYSIGKPIDTPNPDTLDQHEMQVLLANHTVTADGIARIIQGMPLELLLEGLRAALPALLESKRKMATAVLSQPPAEESEDEEEDAEEASAVEAARPDAIPEWLREVTAAEAAPAEMPAVTATGGESNGNGAELLRQLLGRLAPLLAKAAPTVTGQTAAGNGKEAHAKAPPTVTGQTAAQPRASEGAAEPCQAKAAPPFHHQT